MTENQQMQPKQQHITALRKIAEMEAGALPHINEANADECENYGWAEAQPGGGYRLTDEGRRILAATKPN